jgi:hypothetical protein
MAHCARTSFSARDRLARETESRHPHTTNQLQTASRQVLHAAAFGSLRESIASRIAVEAIRQTGKSRAGNLRFPLILPIMDVPAERPKQLPRETNCIGYVPSVTRPL